MLNKSTKFKKLLTSNKLEFLMEAHNGLSAKIVEEAGFSGIWASGLTMSAAMGVRDNNEASWTQVLEVLEFMSDITSIPILCDADTGYGNFNNARRLVNKLEQHQIAAICIEDKLFPKTNSFINSEQQSLADIDEFAGKIKAAKDAQKNPDFCVIARTEALITGCSMSETIRRVKAYEKAGADGILIHSKSKTANQILEFVEKRHSEVPLIVIPTTYINTPTYVYEKAGISIVIWANQLLRASVKTMQLIAAKIQSERSILPIDKEIVPVKEIFRLMNTSELLQAEKKYLKPSSFKK